MTAFLDASQVELRRISLLKRLDRVRPKIVVLIAPAGFGKSTLARQFVAESERSAICDVAGIADDLDLARRLLPALAVEDPGRMQALSQRELMLGDGGTSVADRLSLAVEEWHQPASSAAFVFENAEHIAASPNAREFFGRLMSLRPEGRTVVICSRENLRLHLTRFAPPHEIMTLRAADLAFDRNEIQQIFTPYAQAPQVVDRIAQLSQGWPIAVFLLKRFVQEGRIETLLQKLDDVAFEELHDYLADQVLSSMCRELADAVFACAAIPSAKLEDLRIAFPDSAVLEALEEFTKESPFVTRRDDGAFVVHPLLAAQLLEQHEDRRRGLLAQIAEAHIAAGNFPRAAELELARGDQAAAAEALGKHEVIRDHAPSMEYARVLASLDRTLVQSYPRLWGVTALLRLFCAPTEELLEEAETLWRTLSSDASPLERFYVLLFRLLFMSYIGLFEEAEELLERFAGENEAQESGSVFEAYILYLRGLFRARTGHLVQAEHDLTMALPRISGMDVMMSGTLLTLGADIARVRGEFAVARQFIDRAIAAAKRSTLFNFVAFDYAEATFGAWFSGDDAAFSRYVQRLDEIVTHNGVHGFSYFSAIAIGRNAEPKEADLLKWVVCGQLMASARAINTAQALRLAKSALVSAESYRTPFLECLASIAVAIYDDAQYDEYMRRAEEAAARCESQPLQAAVHGLRSRSNEIGMLEPFVTHLRREHAERVPLLEVSLTSGTVRCQGRAVSLSERELAVLVALALRQEVVPRSRLADLLWPDVDEYAARNALSVTLHRLRQHLGSEDAVVRSGEGYRLHDDVRVDLWEIDRAVTAVRTRSKLTDTDRATLRATYERLRGKRLEKMLNWEWFEPVERHFSEMRLEVAQRLAADALERGETQRALDLAHDMIAYDPCDEPAREIAIRALLLAGETSAAMRHYRQYRETLLAELQCEPSDHIKALVGLATTSDKTA